jgi:peroxiredoxin
VATLVGTAFPTITLPSTTIADDVMQHDRTVIFFYPYTGRPGHPDPEGWDDIPGAHGSTPQAIAFSTLYPEFEKLGVKVCGVSFQTTDWQQEFVERKQLRIPLLSDVDRKLASALSLQTFKAGATDFLVRRTIVVRYGRITDDVSSIPAPEKNAADILQLLQS